MSYEAARKWVHQGFLPRTEWTAETGYAQLIASEYAKAVKEDSQPGLEPAIVLTADMLLAVKPSTQRHAPERTSA